MKKIIALLLVVALAACLGACAAKNTTAETTTAAAETTTAAAETTTAAAETTTAAAGDTTAAAKSGKDLTFGYIAYNMADIWNEYSSEAFKYAADQVGAKVVILDAQNDVAKSVSCMESLIQQGVDGISIFPISGEQGAQLVEMANEAKIPITVENLDMSTFCDSSKYVACVGCVYGDIGYAAIKWLADNVDSAKVFYCAGAVGGGVFEAYKVGVDKALSDNSGKIEMVGLSNGSSWSTEDGLNLTQNFINSGKEFNCIFANNDQMAQGCYQALQAANLDKKVPVVSTGGSPDAYDFVKSGVEAANMTAPVSIQGVQTFMNIYNYVANGTEPTEKFTALPVIPVAGSDLSKWIDWSDFKGAWDYVNNAAKK